MSSFALLDTIGDILAGTLAIDLTDCNLVLFDENMVENPAELAAAYGSGNFAVHELANSDGYITGGKAATGLGLSIVSGQLVLAADPVAWAGATFDGDLGNAKPRYALLKDNASSRAVYVKDFGTARSITSATFTVRYGGDQFFKVSP